jgi:cysteine desulfurase / selenocysteine lyase
VITPKSKTHKAFSIASIRDDIVGLNTRVPLLDGSRRPYIYFDNAASTPILKEVLECVNEFMPWYSSVHRGSGIKSQVATRAYEDAREIVGNFFGANISDHVVIFGKNTTEAINKLSYRLGLSKKDIVLISLMEHHSNDLPWRKVADVQRITVDDLGHLREESLDELLNKYKGQVKLVAISGASNVTGYMPDIHRIARKVHDAGAQILVDCAQLAPHRAINIKSLDHPEHIDYITVSAHKLYAPFGTGALIGRRDTFETGEPELRGGGTIDVVTTQRVEWTSPPDRDEAGSPNVVGAVAFAKALQVLSGLSMTAVAEHESELTAYALTEINKLSRIDILGERTPVSSLNRLGVIPFRVKGLPNELAAAILSAEWGIGVRSGCFCAHPYVTKLLNIADSDMERFRHEVLAGDRSHMPGVIRVSFGIYNTATEVDALIQALKNISAGKYNPNYRQDKSSGEYYPIGWEPDLSRMFSLGN